MPEVQPHVSAPSVFGQPRFFIKDKLNGIISTAIKEQFEVFLPKSFTAISSTFLPEALQEMQAEVRKEIGSLSARIASLGGKFDAAASPSSGVLHTGGHFHANGHGRPKKSQWKSKPSKVADIGWSFSASCPPLPPAGLGVCSTIFEAAAANASCSPELFDLSECSELCPPTGLFANDFVVLQGLRKDELNDMIGIILDEVEERFAVFLP